MVATCRVSSLCGLGLVSHRVRIFVSTWLQSPEEARETHSNRTRSRTSRGWPPPLDPLLAMLSRNYHLQSAINAGSR